MDGMPAAIGSLGDLKLAAGSDDEGIASWVSSDGLVWTPVEVPFKDVADYQSAEMGPIAVLGGRLYSVGFGNIGADTNMPLAWYSDDGTAWAEIPRTDPFFTGYGMVWGIVASNERLIALKNYGLLTGSIWSSTDGARWIDVSPRAAELEPWESGIAVLDVIHNGTRFVVVGEMNDETAGAWVSSDGTEWTAATSGDLAGGSMRAVAAAPGGYVAVGLIDETPAAWSSSDGLEWTRQVLPEAGGRVVPHSVVAIDGGLLAIGNSEAGSATWLSADGVDWSLGESLDTGIGIWLGLSGSNLVMSTGSEVVFLARSDAGTTAYLGTVGSAAE